MSDTVVIIPVLNEEQSIGRVLADIPRQVTDWFIVVDNGSTDATAAVAESAGAVVVHEPRRGYGQACLRGLAEVARSASAGRRPLFVVFLDGDYSDYPEDMVDLMRPLYEGRADMVIGSRMLGERERGALPFHSLFGNWLAGKMLWWLYGQRATDLGPFRALRYDALLSLHMEDRNFGWTAEMQAKAARARLSVVEVPVRYRKRIGRSKITGSIINSCRAGWIIITTLLKHARG